MARAKSLRKNVRLNTGISPRAGLSSTSISRGMGSVYLADEVRVTTSKGSPKGYRVIKVDKRGNKEQIGIVTADTRKEGANKLVKRGYTVQDEKLVGGKGDGRSDASYDTKDLKKGVEHELEHTNDTQVAKEIAKDHLAEDADYYDKLDAIEKRDMQKSSVSDEELLEENDVYDTPPRGWVKTRGASTAPVGYSWYSNGESRFSGKRKIALVRDE